MIIYLYLFIKINLSNKYKTIIFIEYDFFNTLNTRVYDLYLYIHHIHFFYKKVNGLGKKGS